MDDDLPSVAVRPETRAFPPSVSLQQRSGPGEQAFQLYILVETIRKVVLKFRIYCGWEDGSLGELPAVQV